MPELLKKKIGLNQGQFHTIPGNIQILYNIISISNLYLRSTGPAVINIPQVITQSQVRVMFLLMTSVEFGIKKKLSDGGACIPYFEMDQSCDPVTS